MKSEWKKIIIHVDMDAFFAAVEELQHPDLRGKPVIVGADPKAGKGRGVVSTANYEARKFGVHSAMPISRAYRLCPHGIYVPPNGRLYGEYSRQIMNILLQFTPLVQAVSIDEAFMDVTGSIHLYPSVEALGREMKNQIRQQTGLTASIGISPSKSVSKIASDFQKPDGLTIIPPEKVQVFLDPLPVTKLWGVGEKTFASLQHMGINTVGQLRVFPFEILEKKFGKVSRHLHQLAQGIDERDIQLSEPIKSVSHEVTFEADQTDWDLLTDNLLQLSEKVAMRLRKYKLQGKTIQLKLRFDDFTTFSRNRTLKNYTLLTEEIFSTGKGLLDEFYPLPRAVRLIGIGVSNLVDEHGMQISLWENENAKKLQLEKIMDQLQEKFGSMALTHAQILALRKKSQNS